MINSLFQKSILIFLVFFCLTAKAAQVDTVITHSDVMNKDIKAVVIRPNDYSKKKQYSVVYVLHGFGGTYADWITKDPAIKSFADQYHCIIVCPDGAVSSWYIDSPVNPAFKYDTYVSKELVNYVDTHFSTIKDRKGRAVTGLSMGGHGALYLAIKHQDIYGAVGSMSGGMDLKPFSKSFGLTNVLGNLEDDPKRWADHSVAGILGELKPGVLDIAFDCGTDDFFFEVNNALHKQMLEAKIGHDYTVRPGAHTWDYWTNSLNYQMLFFSRYFSRIN
jgi:S-formylglutathione hydrolase FrmB